MWQAVVAWVMLGAAQVSGQVAPGSELAVAPVATGAQLGIGFDRYETLDEFGRTVTYYVSTPPAAQGEQVEGEIRRPLVLVIQGPGCSSIWREEGGNNGAAGERRISGGMQNIVRRDFGGEVRVLAVEKPGVAFLDQSQPADGGQTCSDAFKAHHTPPEWSAALSAALRQALRLSGVDPSRVLVVGHSEGAEMAGYVAAANPDIVTHVACLAGAGITPLFDLTQRAWAEREPGESAGLRTQRVQEVYNTWAAIQRDPGAIDKFAWGHAYKRWSSFAAVSPVESLLATDPRQRLFLAHGTADETVPVVSFDAGLAMLASKGRTAVVRRVPGADHVFAMPGEDGATGLARMLGDVVTWFLVNEPKGPDAPLLEPVP